jgi:hypothetical protein
MDNGNIISRLKVPSITDTETNMRGGSKKICLMVKTAYIDKRKAITTKETSIMAGFMANGPI